VGVAGKFTAALQLRDLFGISDVQNMPALNVCCTEVGLAGIVNTSPASRERLEAFANKTAPKTRPD
jgi:(methylthio)acryloyl-CoA hydratase